MTKEVRNALTPNHDFIIRMNPPKRNATLLPNNWLAKASQTLASRRLASRRLGRQSAERERISEINWNFFKKKNDCKLVLP
ncbi:hypothetical protein [Peribacillus simplex]|uniref:hypothetical protein n=1 Tax=Peribacillus simplex TaxID=1478 RepID=UPI0024C1A239|nr:hypothetical protein [Peribacillus simplex]WHY56311.1 hypothetical protein QNH43_24955 [Peribacillus simplex]